MIHVCYGLYDKDGRYSKFTATSMVSIFENISSLPSSVTVHILHDSTLSQENRDKFVYLAGRYGQIVKFYNVDQLCPDKIAAIKNIMEKTHMFERFSIGTAFRLMMQYIFPKDIDKLIYLDSDIIVNLDINELWQTQLGNKPLATVAELDIGIDHTKYTEHLIIKNGTISHKNYFCAGVLLINMTYFRNDPEVIERGMNFISNSGDCNYFDQDVLNYCFSENYIHLPEKFDVFVYMERGRTPHIRPAIYHYAGLSLKIGNKDAFNQLWFKYFVKTPFFTEETIEHLYEGLLKFYGEQQKFAINVSEMMSGKTRAFFVTPKNAESIKQIFHVKTEEEFILTDSPDALQSMINSLKNAEGKKIFFIVVSRFPVVQQELIKAGLTQGKDFFNAFDFLANASQMPFNSHPLVKLL